jgi:anti-anti-sigma factor
MDFHDDPIATETIILKYLGRTLDAETTEAFESHYLECDQCFAELQASDFLITRLRRGRVDRRVVGDVAVFEVDLADSPGGDENSFDELCRKVLEQKDTKVLIDLSRVSRIDSAGLGMLMQCYSHVIQNRGMLKVVHPNPQVLRLLSMTKIDSVIEAYVDESEALRAFHQGSQSGSHPE